MKKSKWKKGSSSILAVLLLVWAAVPALAAEAQDTLTLEQVLQAAAASNPQVVESQKRLEEKQARIGLATALPNPEFGVMKDYTPS